MSDDITKNFKSVQGYNNRFDMEKETKSRLIEKHLYGDLRSRTRFDAYVLHGWNYTDSKGGKIDDTGRYLACYLRPKDIHNFMIPAPCPNSVQEAKFIVSMHPIGISESPLKGTDSTFSVGDVVSCFWDQSSPAFNGQMRGLRFELGKVSHARGNYDFKCLKLSVKELGFSGTGEVLGKKAKKKTSSKHEPVVPAGNGETIAKPYHIDKVGLDELIDSEGKRYTVYDDKNGKSVSSYSQVQGYPTIGVGHLIKSGEKTKYAKYLKGKQKMPISEMKTLLDGDVIRKEKRLIGKITQPITQSMWNALISLAYNTGSGSTWVNRCIAAINKKDYQAAQKVIANGPVTSKGKKLAGLVKRRAREAEWFMSEGLPK